MTATATVTATAHAASVATTTARLALRPYTRADVDALAAWIATPRGAAVYGPLSPMEAWAKFAVEAGQWPLHGHGGLAITLDGALAGRVVIQSRPDYPEPEMGWLLLDGFEGRGLAHEAASAVRDWARGHPGLPSLVSYVARGNARSAALAERLGARRDPAAVAHRPDVEVFRHWGPA